MQSVLAFDPGCSTPQRWGAGHWKGLLLSCYQLMQATLLSSGKSWACPHRRINAALMGTVVTGLAAQVSHWGIYLQTECWHLSKENSTRLLQSQCFYHTKYHWKETTSFQSNRSNEEYRKHTNKIGSQEPWPPRRAHSVTSAPVTSSHFYVFSDDLSWKISKHLMEFSQPPAVSSINFNEHCRW